MNTANYKLKSSRLIKNRDIYNHNTRQTKHFHFPKNNSRLLISFICFQGVQLWNTLMDENDVNVSISKFKKSLKLNLLNLQN